MEEFGWLEILSIPLSGTTELLFYPFSSILPLPEIPFVSKAICLLSAYWLLSVDSDTLAFRNVEHLFMP